MKYFLLLLLLVPFSVSKTAVDSFDSTVLETLAQPDFEGRGVGTLGLNKSRDLLVAQLKAAGIAPAFTAADGTKTYTQAFRVFIGNELGLGNHFGSSDAQTFMPFAFSKSGSVADAEIAFVGFGISLREGGETVYDDYAGIDVKGKIVVALLGDPGIGNRQSKFRNPAYYQYSTPIYKVQNAELHGAAGIVLVRDPMSQSEAEPPLRFQSRQGGGSSMSILAGQAKIDFVAGILQKDLLALQSKISDSQAPSSFLTGLRSEMRVDLLRQLGSAENVVGLIPGTDLVSEVIVLGAHYDHLGYGGDSSLDPNGIGKVHPGADDNASGVQGVLDIARSWSGKSRRTLLVAFFSAEEIGLLGSKNLVENLPLQAPSKVVAMVNLDMVGRLQDNKLSALALKSGKNFSALVDDVNQNHGFALIKSDTGFGSSDHASFLQQKIPALFFTTGAHGDYHRPSDTADKIQGAGLRRIENYVADIMQGIDRETKAPEYDPASEDPAIPGNGGKGYGVYFGSIPEFSQGVVDGVLLQGVKPDSPAEKAGLKAGDVLTQLGEIQIKNLYDLVFALRFYRPKEEVDVVWKRAQEIHHARAVLRARDN